MAFADIDFGMIGKIATTAIGAHADYSIQKTQHSMDMSALKHKQQMKKISQAMQMNSVSLKEAELHDKSIRMAQTLQITSLKDKGNAEVAAAAAGVAGGSVDMTMQGLERASLNANFARIKNVRSAEDAMHDARKNITLQGVFSDDIGVLVPPSPSMALLGFGASAVDIYNENQPEGTRTSDSLAGLFKKLGGK